MPDLYPLARKALFQFDAETAHHLTLGGMKTAHRLGLLEALVGKAPEGKVVRVMGLDFPNPVGLAAGMDKTASAVGAFGALGFGHVEVGTVTPRPQPGNAKPRLFRLIEHEAIINRMGFNNPGVEAVMENLAVSRKGYRGIVGINIGKNFDTPNENALDDYLKAYRAVYTAADYIAVNISSPNTKGLRDLQAASQMRDLIRAIQDERALHSDAQPPIALKIAPDLEDEHIAGLAEVFNETGIDAVIATNTTIDRDAVKSHPRAEEAGGLSGAPVRSPSTHVIRELRNTLHAEIPIIGVGGISCAEDAREKLDAGAALVQIYTGLVYRGAALVHDVAAL